MRCAVALGLVLACALGAQPPREPYKDARKTAGDFAGPGRDRPEPTGLSEVAIGYFGPAEESHPDGGSLWRGAMLALDEANRNGGYRGKPFRLISRWSEDPWRAGASHITRMAFQDRVWAIVGGIEGAGTHLAEQVVAKALLPLVNPVATDRSIHLAGVPWMFSVVAGDDAHAAQLGRVLQQKRIVLFAATDHDSRAYLSRLKPVLGQVKASVVMHVEFESGRADLAQPAERATTPAADVVVIIAAARDSGRAVRALRAAGYRGPVAGGPWLGRDSFRSEAGNAAEGTVFTLAAQPSHAFTKAYEQRYGVTPDYAAACGHDAVALLVQAIRRSGLNRSRIRDALAAIEHWVGAGGTLEWDEFGQNRRTPVLVEWHSNRIVPVR
jgi:branched-chain amino acid transport system substrate-binding protein